MGSQSTILIVQNLRTSAFATGSILFFDAIGLPLAEVPLSVPARGVQIVPTQGVPGLAGQAGSVRVVHDAGYGGLAGKAVALEPSTGFTFDTPLTPIPY